MMIVVSVTNCPPSLRGDLSLWLQEIDTGLFVGNTSARVREHLWTRIQDYSKKGSAVMVFSAKNEQKLDFYTHNTYRKPVDFDGLKLMLIPSAESVGTDAANDLADGFSKVAKMQTAKRVAKAQQKSHSYPAHYLLLDVETTGLQPATDHIIEIAAVEVNGREVVRILQSLIKIGDRIPMNIRQLTGITDKDLQEQGKDLSAVIAELIQFAGDLPVVSHNARFDYNFLRTACRKYDLPEFSNPCTDTYLLAKRLLKDVRNYKLATLALELDIRIDKSHRGLEDCFTTKVLYEKLIEILDTEK